MVISPRPPLPPRHHSAEVRPRPAQAPRGGGRRRPRASSVAPPWKGDLYVVHTIYDNTWKWFLNVMCKYILYTYVYIYCNIIQSIAISYNQLQSITINYNQLQSPIADDRNPPPHQICKSADNLTNLAALPQCTSSAAISLSFTKGSSASASSVSFQLHFWMQGWWTACRPSTPRIRRWTFHQGEMGVS